MLRLFSFVRNFQSVFQSGSTVSYSHQQYNRIYVVLYPYEHFFVSSLYCHSTGCALKNQFYFYIGLSFILFVFHFDNNVHLKIEAHLHVILYFI